MKVIMFGATGMIGHGVLRECLADPQVTQVLAVGRTSTEEQDPKLQELLHKDLTNFESIRKDLTGFDACFFCLGTPSAGKSEEDYSRITYDITLAAARALQPLNPQMTFIYVSGEGADSTEKGRVMWARVRGRVENDLFKIPFKGVYIFRPGIVMPVGGVQSKTTLYRVFYSGLKPLLPIMWKIAPKLMSTTQVIGRAMLKVAREGADKRILFSPDFKRLAGK